MSNKGRPIQDAEQNLWERFVAGIRPLKKSDNKATPQPQKEKQTTPHNTTVSTPNLPLQKQTAAQPPSQPTENTLDRRTLDKLKKGKMAIEATIDLHDKTQDQAYTVLVGFVTRAFQSQKRCVLVITGKGKNTKADDFFFTSKQDGVGILKSRLPEWVSQPPLNEMVLKHVTAHRNHGGEGAFYLYLKRHRPTI